MTNLFCKAKVFVRDLALTNDVGGAGEIKVFDAAVGFLYINDELYEMCPNQATEEEAEMRLHEIMDELWIEWNDEPVWKEIN